MNPGDEYYLKYLKYKNKYNNLKNSQDGNSNMNGGGIIDNLKNLIRRNSNDNISEDRIEIRDELLKFSDKYLMPYCKYYKEQYGIFSELMNECSKIKDDINKYMIDFDFNNHLNFLYQFIVKLEDIIDILSTHKLNDSGGQTKFNRIIIELFENTNMMLSIPLFNIIISLLNQKNREKLEENIDFNYKFITLLIEYQIILRKMYYFEKIKKDYQERFGSTYRYR